MLVEEYRTLGGVSNFLTFLKVIQIYEEKKVARPHMLLVTVYPNNHCEVRESASCLLVIKIQIASSCKARQFYIRNEASMEDNCLPSNSLCKLKLLGKD